MSDKLSFAAVNDIWPTLTVLAKLCLPSAEELGAYASFNKQFKAFAKGSVAFQTPTVLSD